MQLIEIIASEGEETARSSALGCENTWHVKALVRRPVFLEWAERKEEYRMNGDELDCVGLCK